MRYQVVNEPVALLVCHCRVGISVTVNRRDVLLVRDEITNWARPTDSGRTPQCVFCPIFGSRVWHGNNENAEIISIKGGSLDKSIDLSNGTNLCVSRKLPWVVIPGDAKRYERESAEFVACPQLHSPSVLLQSSRSIVRSVVLDYYA